MAGEGTRINGLTETTSPAGTDNMAVDTPTGVKRATVNTVRNLATAVPPMNGAAAVGASAKAAREDHVHPVDTSRAAASHTHDAGALTAGTIADARIPANIPRMLTANTTVNFTPGMTAAQMQALIDAQPKNLNGFTLTFQFGDGTYSLNSRLNFVGFFGGTLLICGNAAEETLASTKSVILDFSATIAASLYIQACDHVKVNGLHVKTLSGAYCVYSAANTRFDSLGCVLQSLGSSTGSRGAYIEASFASIKFAHFIGGHSAITSTISACVQINTCQSDSTTPPLYGLNAAAGIIYRVLGQPSGSTANEIKSYGGQIW